MKEIKPIDLDLSLTDLGQHKLPEQLQHLKQYEKYAKPLKEDVWGFKIPQFFENGSPNDDWYTFRTNQVGSSEIATLLDLDEYGDQVKLFYNKLGEKYPFFNSRFTVLGLELEERISDFWQYHDGTDEGWVDNLFFGKKVREKVEMPFYAINVNYPHLAVSCDFLIPGGQANPFTGEIENFDKPLEIKNISQLAHDKYKLGIPERYLCQLQIQMLILGVTSADIAYLVAGNNFKVMPVDLDVKVCQAIITKSYIFWEKVKEGRELYVDYYDKSEEEQIAVDAKLQHIEPEPSGNEAFKEFYHEKYKVSRTETTELGTDEQWELAVDYMKTNDTIKELTRKKEQLGQKIKLSTRHVEVTDFGENGRIINRRPESGRGYFKVNAKNYKDE